MASRSGTTAGSDQPDAGGSEPKADPRAGASAAGAKAATAAADAKAATAAADAKATATDAQAAAAGAAEPSARRRIRRRWVAVLLALLAIVALVAVEVGPIIFPPKTNQTIWQAITSGISADGSVPKQTALEAFAYDYKVSIPGVTIPSGIEGGDEPNDGTGPMNWVRANWSSLTADQQAVINRYINPGSGDQTYTLFPSVAPTATPTPTPTPSPTDTPTPEPTETPTAAPFSSESPSAGSSPGASASASASPAAALPFRLADFRRPSEIPVQVAPDAPLTLAGAMQTEVMNDIAHIGPKLGMPVLSGGSAVFPNIELVLSDTDGGNTLFLTQVVYSQLHYEPCHITAWKNAWQNEQVTSNGGVSPTLHVLITHEVVHCYQNVVWASDATALAIPPWITEGTAMWLAADDTGVAEPMMPSMWKNGYFIPETPLTARSYDAYGYYALLAQLGRDMWGLMYPAWQAAAAAPQRSNAFIGVLTGDAPDVRNNWAESYLRQDGWGNPWIAYGFGLPADAQVTQHPAQAQSEPGWDGSVNSRANTVLSVDSTDGEVVEVSTDGLASVHDNGNNSATAFQDQRFCTKTEGCVCPPDTLLAGQNMASQQLEIPFVAAFNAPEGGSKYNITSYKLDDLCKKLATPAPQPSPNYGPCGANCTQSNGDPHMLTVNKTRYDFQAAGEFTLLKSYDGSLEIQARQEPWQDSKTVAINTAIAAKVGGHRVGVYVADQGLQAEVDGKVVDLSAGPMDLGNGGRVATVSKGFEIDFPDGTQMWTLSVGQWGINAQIKPSESLKTSGAGLLGAIIPGGLGLPALPDGTRLPAITGRDQQFQTVYGKFADAWRVTDSTSLFDYDSGKSTATYTIKPFPLLPATLAGLTSSQKSAGDAACSAITEQGAHDDCVLDVGITGQTGFAQGYQDLQGFYLSGPGASAVPTASSASSTPAPGAISGAFTVAKGENLGGYAVGDGDIVYMSVQTGDNAYSLIAFDPVGGKIVNQVSVAAQTPVHFAAGSVWLPGLKTDANGRDCSVTRFDGTTLAEQATIATPCSPFGNANYMASDGDALWFLDSSKYDLTTGNGTVVTRIDPTTNTPGASVAVPFAGGYMADSQGAFFYYDSDKGWYRLTSGASSFDSMGVLRNPRPAGTGLWMQDNTGTTAQYETQGGSVAATVQVGGNLAGGDTKAVYTEVLGNSDAGVTQEQLWRYPIDGSTPTEIATSPTIDGDFLSYVEDPLPNSNGDGFLKVWLKRVGSDELFSILLQWTPVK